VEDVARAFDTILHKGLVGHIYNIGGTNEFSNLEVAKKLLTLMGKVCPPHPCQVARLL
jgi:dTDP-D-glucose 4,6-dehydratase